MQHAVNWAGLQQELVQSVCAHADDSSRLSLMLACKPWRAAVLAAPHLIPTAVVRLPSPHEPPADITGLLQTSDVAALRHEDMVEEERALHTAEALHPLTYCVRIEGSDDHEQAVLLTAVIALLPRGVHELHLQANCSGLYLRQLRQLPNLRKLVLSGNTAFAHWKGAVPLLPMLHEGLHLDCCWQLPPEAPYYSDVELHNLPPGIATALAAATCLTALELTDAWCEDVTAVCTALSDLRRLKLTLHYCDGNKPAEAVSMLHQLPHLQSLDLWVANVAALKGPDADGASWIGNGDIEWGPVPPLAGLPLRALTLQGAVGLPPDWRQLACLEELRVVSSPEYAQPLVEGDPHSCLQRGEEPAAELTSLTRLEIKNVPPPVSVAASLPTLRVVRDIRGRQPEWRAALAAARPDVQIIAE